MKVSISSEAKKEIMSWLENIEDGDRIVFRNGRAIAYNSSGCEINYVDC